MKKGLVLATALFVFGMQCGVQANFTDNFRSEYGKELCLEYVEVYNISKKNIDPQGPGFIYSKQGKNWFSRCQAPVYEYKFGSKSLNDAAESSDGLERLVGMALKSLFKKSRIKFLGYETVTEHFANPSQFIEKPHIFVEKLRFDLCSVEKRVFGVDSYNGIRYELKNVLKNNEGGMELGRYMLKDSMSALKNNEGDRDLYTIKALMTGEINDKRIEFMGTGKEDLFGETFIVEKYKLKQYDGIASLDDKKMKMMGIQNQSAESLVQSLTWICKLYYRDNGELVYFTSFGRDEALPKGTEKLKVNSLDKVREYLNVVVGVTRPRYYHVTDLSKEFDVDSYNELKNCELKTFEEANAIVQQMANEAKDNYEQEQQDIRDETAREFEENRRQQVADGIRQSKLEYAKMKIRQAPLERRMQRIKKK